MKRTLLPVAALTAIYLAALALWPESLNHNSEYAWPVLRHGVAGKLIPASLSFFIIIVIFTHLTLSIKWQVSGLIKWIKLSTFLFFISICSQIIPMTVHRMGLVEFPLRIYLPDHTSYFTDAVRYIGIMQRVELITEFPQKVDMLILETHSRTHPPGAILFFRKFIDLSSKLPGFVSWYNHVVPRSQEAGERFKLISDEVAAGGLAALAIILFACLVPAMMIWLRYPVQNNQEIIWLGATFFLLTPNFSSKTPVLDQFAGFIIMGGVILFLNGLPKNKTLMSLFSGLLLTLGLWLSYTFLAAFPLVFFVAAAWQIKTKSVLSRAYLTSFFLGIGAGLLIILAWVAPGNLLAIYRANLAGWHFNNITSGRIHMWKWILFNPYEFFAWLGIPIFCFFALAVWREVKKVRLRQWSEADPLVWAIFIFGVALDLSGRVCYESPRLCWFYAPFVCLVAAKGFANTEGLNRGWGLAVVLVLQAATVLVFRMLF